MAAPPPPPSVLSVISPRVSHKWDLLVLLHLQLEDFHSHYWDSSFLLFLKIFFCTSPFGKGLFTCGLKQLVITRMPFPWWLQVPRPHLLFTFQPRGKHLVCLCYLIWLALPEVTQGLLGCVEGLVVLTFGSIFQWWLSLPAAAALLSHLWPSLSPSAFCLWLFSESSSEPLLRVLVSVDTQSERKSQLLSSDSSEPSESQALL